MDLIDELAAITPQRPLCEVAKECDIAFADGPVEVEAIIVPDPFRAGLDCSRNEKKTCLVVLVTSGHFTVISPDARWVRSLRLYQSLGAK